MIIVYFGGASLLAFTAIAIRNNVSYIDILVNMPFSILIIPMYLAIITTIYIYIVDLNVYINKSILFILSMISLVVAINIIHMKYSGFLWEIFATPGNDAQIIALVVILLALVVYYIGYALIKLIMLIP